MKFFETTVVVLLLAKTRETWEMPNPSDPSTGIVFTDVNGSTGQGYVEQNGQIVYSS